jgi:MarR family transcriptional repressor of emrRAB
VIRNTAELDRTTNLFGALALVATDAMREATEQAAGHGAAAPAALVALHQFVGGKSVDDLRRAVGLTHSGAVRLIDRLVEDGYVVRQPGADADRRAVSVILTARGRQAARDVLSARADALEPMLAALTREERAALGGLLEKLVEASTTARLASRQQGQQPAGGWMCRLCDAGACGRDRGQCPAATTTAALVGL